MKKEIRESLVFASVFTIIDLVAYLFKIENAYFMFSILNNNVLNVILNVIIDFTLLFSISWIVEKIILIFKKKKK